MYQTYKQTKNIPIVILFRVNLLSVLWNLHIRQFGLQCRNIRQPFGRHSVHEVQQFYIGSFTVMGIIIIKSRETDISSLMSHSFDVVRATKCFWAFHIWEIKRKREGGGKRRYVYHLVINSSPGQLNGNSSWVKWIKTGALKITHSVQPNIIIKIFL